MAQWATLLETARHWSVQYAQDRVIYGEAESASAVYRVESGCVRLQVDGADGARQILSFHYPGELFGMSVDQRESAAEAVTDVSLTRYSLGSLLELSAGSTEVVRQLLSIANNLYGDLGRHLQRVTHMSAAERALDFLEGVARRQALGFGDWVPLPMSRRDISDHLGLSPETLSRVLQQLRREGHVSFLGQRSFVLCDTERGGWRRPSSSLDLAVRPAAGLN
jgi:CRP/FNR family nitrogen fixation transcriptional regulator